MVGSRNRRPSRRPRAPSRSDASLQSRPSDRRRHDRGPGPGGAGQEEEVGWSGIWGKEGTEEQDARASGALQRSRAAHPMSSIRRRTSMESLFVWKEAIMCPQT
jgi:hypothetical protein